MSPNRSTTPSIRRLRAATGAAALAAVALVAPAALPLQTAQAAPGTLRVVDHNIEKRNSVLDRVVDEARQRDAHALTLQEVCASQAGRLDAAHPGWTVHFSATRANGCATGDAVGTVVAWRKGSTARADDYLLTPDGTGDRVRTPSLSCLTFGSAPVRHVCSVHLVSRDTAGVRPTQTQEIKNLTQRWIVDENHLVVVGGDFNTTPDNPAMDSIFARGAGNDGRFVSAHELEGRAERTTDSGRQIDYVFVSANRAASGSLEVVPTGSDHHLLAATIRYS